MSKKETGVPGLLVSSMPKSGIKRAGTFTWGKVKMKTESKADKECYESTPVGQALVRASKNSAKDLIAKLHRGCVLPIKRKGPNKVSDG